MDLTERKSRLERARLYFVCDIGMPPEELDALLGTALAGGVDIVQLRDKSATERAVLAAATLFREAADRHGALFFVNDDPVLAVRCGADGVHVGQDDIAVAEARAAGAAGGSELLVGLSTHAPAQLAAAERSHGDDRPDYLSVGPVWETPTKPGRPAAGIDYVAHAAAAAELPWFAIGSIDPGNVGSVLEAGAQRIVVVRAIRDADEPGDVARELSDALAAAAPGAGAGLR